MSISRRTMLAGSGALALWSRSAMAADPSKPITLGVLTPLSGAGGFDGPRMVKAMQAVADEVNAGGGIAGRKVMLSVQDDQTDPDSAVRAAHGLIDVTHVPVIMGTWASAVTTAVAPLCWEAQVMLFTVSGADTITQLPHRGYILRTQPNNKLQATRHGEFIAGLGLKRVFLMSVQAPFDEPTKIQLGATLKENGSELVGALVYEGNKPSYRTEVDLALRSKPDLVYLNGYAPDVLVLLRDLYRAGYTGQRFTQSYALTDKSLATLPPDVSEGCYTAAPSSDVGSEAYARTQKRLGLANPDSYVTQATDWISLALLAIAEAKSDSGPDIHDHVRRISQGDGIKVYDVPQGLAALAKGQQINYEGASGPCDFNEIGDILDCKFRFQKVQNGKLVLVKIA